MRRVHPSAPTARPSLAAVIALVLAAALVAGCQSPESLPQRPSTTPEAPEWQPRTFTVLGSGDVLLHQSLWYQAQRDAAAGDPDGYDFGPLFASARPTIAAADLAICNLETPLGPSGGPFSGYPLFSVPPQVLDALVWVGYDGCSTASNHTIDKGEAGVIRTLDALDKAGIRHTGSARSAAEQGEVTILEAQGVKVGWVAYTFSLNGLTRPRGKEYLANYPLDTDRILDEARRARAQGAEVVIASLHWGTEYSFTPNAQQKSVARTLLNSPEIDLILGHHPHVVQPMEKIGDKWVAYSMGNQVSTQNASDQPMGTRDGIMPVFRFTEVEPGVFQVTDVQVHSLFMYMSQPLRLYDVSATLTSGANVSATLRNQLLASMRRSYDTVGKAGAYESGAVLVGARLFLE